MESLSSTVAASRPEPSPVPNGPVEARLEEHLADAMANPPESPGRPNVLLIGDSISIGYTVPVRVLLGADATVHRPPVNCQHTAYGLANLDAWLGMRSRWAAIHFNWGIWDTHYLDRDTGELVRDEAALPPERMRIRHTPEEYRRNLARLVDRLRQTGARLVWASSTPIMFRRGPRFEDVATYNSAAAAVMKARGIPTNDLYAHALPHVTDWQSPDQCHFNDLGNRKLGEKVTECIKAALPSQAIPVLLPT